MDVLDLTPYDQLSLPMRQVVDALVEGVSPPPDALAVLSPEESAQVQALLRTARLTTLALNAPEPPDQAQEAALRRAKSALEARDGDRSAPSAPPSRRTLKDLLRGFRRGNTADDEEKEA